MVESETQNIHILHVDDDPSTLEISKQILMDMNATFKIDHASSVDEAFKKIANGNYEIVISDYEMPQKNGLDFLKELREQGNQIGFILFTGKGREEVAIEAFNSGADRYLNKNGSPEAVYYELAHSINKLVERKRSKNLLAASELKYRMLVENSLQGILVAKADPLRYLFANTAMGKILGYTPQELISLSPQEIEGLVYSEDRAVFFKRMENRLCDEPGEYCFEFRAVRRDGTIIWLSALASRVEFDGQTAVQGMFIDITENKKATDILRKSEMRYKDLANFFPEEVFETDLTGKVIFFNQRALEVMGFTREEAEKDWNILSFVASKDRERASLNLKKSATGETAGLNEYELVRKYGTTFPALVSNICENCHHKFLVTK
jgi:PAS domain S-box-containing protein